MTNFNSELLLSKIAVKLTSKLTEDTLATQYPQGSGVIYQTTPSCEYLYVFTALHCVFGDRSIKNGKNVYPHDLGCIDHVLVEHNNGIDTAPFRKEKILACDIITDTKNDFCILKVKKSLINNDKNFPEIFLHSNKRKDGKFRSSGFASTNRNQYLPLELSFLSTNAEGILMLRSEGDIHSDNAIGNMGGYSGSGLFINQRPILVGIITKLSDNTAIANSVHAKDLSFIDINKLLNDQKSGNEELNYTNNAKKIITDEDDNVIDLSRVKINGVYLNIWKAVGNIKKDMKDDWFQDAIDFTDILHSETIHKLIINSLIDGNYRPSSSEIFSVPKEGFTIRWAVQTTILDRVVYQAVVDYIANELDKKAIINNIYSARYNYNNATNFNYFFNNSVEQWQKFQHQIQDTLTSEKPYLVVTDITSFYDNISLAALKIKLNDHIAQVSNKPEYNNAVDLVTELIQKWQTHQGYTSNGIPQNRDPSAFLANIFLAHIDRQMRSEFTCYYRFMDDIRIVCKDKYEARKALMSLIDKLSEIGLNLNSQKTRILYLDNAEDLKLINEYTPVLEKEIEQICSLMDSGKSREVQIAVKMVDDLFHRALANYHENGNKKKFRFAIERLQRFARTPLLCNMIDFSEVVKAIIERFEDNPWYTEIYIRFLTAVDKQYITPALLDILVPLIIDDNKNIYPWQSYSIFKLLAFHKITHPELQKFAEFLVTRSMGIDRAPEVAGACLYLVSIDDGTVGIIKRSLNKGYFESYITKRCALLCLQSIDPAILNQDQIDPALKEIHQKAYNKFTETGEQAPLVAGLGKLKINHISRDLPQIISL